jgi:hypothetical protein
VCHRSRSILVILEPSMPIPAIRPPLVKDECINVGSETRSRQ